LKLRIIQTDDGVYSVASRPRLPPRLVLRNVKVATLSGKAAMILLRSSGDSPIQSEISPRVRPQPMQNPVSGSTTQILMQGVSIVSEEKLSMGTMCCVMSSKPSHEATLNVKAASVLEVGQFEFKGTGTSAKAGHCPHSKQKQT
jgi:hypothetical protein